MRVIELQFAPWDQIYYFGYPEDIDSDKIKLDDQLVVKTAIGTEIGRAVGFRELSEREMENLAAQGQDVKTFVRLATDDDLAQLRDYNKNNEEEKTICRQFIKRNGLNMKLVDCHCSFDGSRLSFAFIADGRVDFRNLVKDLTKRFKKSIRLQQLGVRDEARFAGDFGSCGRDLCCQKHLEELGNVSTDFAKDQMIAHRGSERLSGLCGRLKCCLAYEEDFYKQETARFPRLGDKVKTKQGNGEVIGINLLKQSFDVRVQDEKKGEIIVKVDVK
jgi:cell fate regulator YaaT (PSP1 superfamily)